MRVAHTATATWRGRSTTQEATRLDLHHRAVATMRRLTDDALPALRDRAMIARVHKARSETQGPSALERLWEILVALHAAGVEEARLREVLVETAHLLDDLHGHAPASVQEVLEAAHQANVASCAEQLAESALSNRADRALTIGDLDRYAETTRAEIAAKKVQLLAVSRLRRQIAQGRGLNLVRGSVQ